MFPLGVGSRAARAAYPGQLVSGAGANSVGPVSGFLNWWDGNELWLSGLAFVLQAMIVMPVVLVVAYFTAGLLDGLLGRGIKLMRRIRHADGAPG
jgi:hypothetical protein